VGVVVGIRLDPVAGVLGSIMVNCLSSPIILLASAVNLDLRGRFLVIFLISSRHFQSSGESFSSE